MPSAQKNRNEPPRRNVVGLEIRRVREQRNWSQHDLARELQLAGWDVERTVLTKIELRRRCVTDYELLFIAKALRVTPNDLMPKRPELDHFFNV